MLQLLFHGSDHIIKKPKFHAGWPDNDYGHGFYCTRHEDLAKEWAVTRMHDGFANAYQINLSGLTILDLARQASLINWLAILLANRTFNLDTPLAREAYNYIQRHFAVDLNPYDIVTGYRADDSYFSFAQDFLNNTISYEQLSYAMKLGNLGEQVVIRSRAAYSKLVFIGSQPVRRDDWLARKELRDRAARNAYLHSDRMRYHRGELYMMEILDKEVKADDPRLQ